MKKFLVMLMVVAMASFLFVGCLGTTPPIEPDEPVEPVLPASIPPTILDIQDSLGTSIVDLTSTATQYINKVEAGTSILVTGIAGPKALVQVYIGGTATPVAAGTAGTTGLFSVAIAKATLGADSLVAKTLHATSTELGLAESAASNVATFILDTVAPSIKTSSAKGSTAGFVKVVEETELFEDTLDLFGDWTITDPTIAIGMWSIAFSVTNDTDGDGFLSYGDKITFTVTPPTGDPVMTTYIYTYHYYDWTLTPGLTVTIPDYDVDDPDQPTFAELAEGGSVGVNIFTEWQGKDEGYIDVTFDGDVTSASILEGVWTVATSWWSDTSPTRWFDVSVKSNAVARISSWDLDAGDMYFISCIGIEDLAGNSIPATAPSTDTGNIVAQ